MSRDLRRLLHDTSVEPTDQPDPSELVTRGRRRRRRRHAASAISGVAAVVLVGVAALQVLPRGSEPEILDQPPDSVVPTASTSGKPASEAPITWAQRLSWPEGPSQTPEAAAEQGVPAEVAALPLADRIELRGGTDAPEGLYVTSGLPFDVGEPLADETGRLSDGTGWGEYEEILLLDPDTRQVVRAWPTAGLSLIGPPIVMDEPNVVAAPRVGDGAEPWSSLILLDRETGVRRGFVTAFPPEIGRVDSPWVNADWIQTDLETLPAELIGAVDGKLGAIQPGEVVIYDHTTMTVDARFDIESDASWLSAAGDGVIVEHGERPARFLNVTSDGTTPSSTLPDLPGYASAASTTAGQPVAVTFDDGRRNAWVLEDGQWREVAESRQDVGLHIVDGRTYVTIDQRLLEVATPIAERAVLPGEDEERGSDVLAARSDGGLLWIAHDIPFLVRPAS